MITIPTKSAKYYPENQVCHIFALEINYFWVLLSVRALLTRAPKRNKRKVVSGGRVTLPVNFACKPRLSFNPLAKVTPAVGLPNLLVNRVLQQSWLTQTHFPTLCRRLQVFPRSFDWSTGLSLSFVIDKSKLQWLICFGSTTLNWNRNKEVRPGSNAVLHMSRIVC